VDRLTKKILILFLFLFFTLFLLFQLCFKTHKSELEISRYPDGKTFAFSITEDPDYGSFEKTKLMYTFLDSIGLKTTVAVWVMDDSVGSGSEFSKTNTRGATTTNPDYLGFVKFLQERGFEICLHTVSPGNDRRERTIKGYEIFLKHFGSYPKININHANNLENIYWGKHRFSNFFLKFLYGIRSENFYGHEEKSEYFWGDICKEKTKYVRSWATNNINTLAVNKTMPYYVNDKPYVNYWFGCSDGSTEEKFMDLISDNHLHQLEEENGTSIIYTHFAYGFFERNLEIHHKFKTQMLKISRLNGWFVPVSKILDRFLLLRNINIVVKNNLILLINHNDETIEGLTISITKDRIFFQNKKEWKYPNDNGMIILGKFLPNSVIKLSYHGENIKKPSPGKLESFKMIKDWFISRF
jgi:hypothetical protein